MTFDCHLKTLILRTIAATIKRCICPFVCHSHSKIFHISKTSFVCHGHSKTLHMSKTPFVCHGHSKILHMSKIHLSVIIIVKYCI